ncbi:MAG: FAD-dependent oxidoreductase, partial [Planctomycetales bacterium]|nr:FAD-dependent oxidoreductase [Planctomycetales bacterium]
LRGLGVDVRCGAQITEVRSRDAGPEVVTPAGVEGFDRVVLTVPSPAVAQLCPGMAPAERERHASQEYIGVVCASVLLERPLADYYVTNITDSGLPFTAVIEMTALVDPAELNGARLVYLPRYALAEDDIWRESDESIKERFLKALESMYPDFRREDVRAFQVSRARSVLPLPALHYSSNLPAIHTSLPGVSVVNSVRIVGGTLNVNETIQLAERAVAENLLPSLTAQSPAPATPEVVS